MPPPPRWLKCEGSHEQEVLGYWRLGAGGIVAIALLVLLPCGQENAATVVEAVNRVDAQPPTVVPLTREQVPSGPRWKPLRSGARPTAYSAWSTP